MPFDNFGSYYTPNRHGNTRGTSGFIFRVCEYSIRIIELSYNRATRMYEAVLVVLNVSKFLPFVHYRNFPSVESCIK